MTTAFRPSNTDKATRCLLQSVLTSHGFKWSYRHGTDLCRGSDFVVELNDKDVMTVRFKKSTGGFFSGGRTKYSKAEGLVTRIEVPKDLTKSLRMVVVKRPVAYFDWNGKREVD